MAKRIEHKKNRFDAHPIRGCPWDEHLSLTLIFYTMKTKLYALLLATIGCSCQPKEMVNPNVEYIHTEIGTLDNRASNCVIGPQLPYGSINPSPQTPHGGMDGYDPKDPISGFGQLHVSGTGWSSYGHFLISPQVGLSVGTDQHDSPYSQQISKAYYYKTHLDKYNITAEVAPAYYSAIYRFKYPSTKEAHIVFDASQRIMGDLVKVNNTIYNNECVMDSVKQQIRMKIRYEGGWPEGAYDLYLVGEYDQPATEVGVWKSNQVLSNDKKVTNDVSKKQHIGGYCKFDTSEDDEVLLKVAISFTSYEKAECLLKQEIPGWDFEKVKSAGRLAWSQKIKSIDIESVSEDQRTIFYSALYRVFTMARDRSQDNARWKSDQPFWDDNYAFWDTFRTVYPLLTLIDEKAVRDNILAIIDRFKHNGCVYDGFIAGNERTGDQGGNDVDHVIVDAYLKGVKGIDWKEAYKVVKYNADKMRLGFNGGTNKGRGLYDKYKELGWIPASIMSSSQTLEFAYNDYCVALMAKGLGYEEDYHRYMKRSGQWVKLWNPNLQGDGFTGFMDACNEDGTYTNLNPSVYGGSWALPFYEASSWTYSYYVPHDFDQLIRLMGGKEKFIQRLSYGFEHNKIEYTNEPAFLATRAFTHADRPDLSSYWAHHTMNTYYDLTGYPGNDDTGSMSSWYVFCAMGFFPNAGQDYYYLNAPSLLKSVITMADGHKLTITANAAKENVYIKSCEIDGKMWNSPFIKHEDLMKATSVKMELSSTPTSWGRE